MSFQQARHTAFSTPVPVSHASRGQALKSTCARSTETPTMISLPKFRNPWSKQSAADKKSLTFEYGYTYLAHPNKDTGEDAFFIEGNAAGVFDGVSGAFETRGVDPRMYSQRLAGLTRDKVREYGAGSVVKAAIDASLENEEIGASTACVVGMEEGGRLFGINLGDSGVRLVRGGRVVLRTKEQQHFFNCPYQLGTDSEDGLAMGQNVQTRMKVGDMLVVATDGLYDNVSDGDIVTVVDRLAGKELMEVAEALGDLASVRAVDDTFESPFMKAAEKAGVEWKGGKADDITVVVLKVVEGKPEADGVLSTIPEAEGSAGAAE